MPGLSSRNSSTSRSPSRGPALTLLNLDSPPHLESAMKLATECCQMPIGLRHRMQQVSLYATISAGLEQACIPCMVAEPSNIDSFETTLAGFKAEHEKAVKAREEMEDHEWHDAVTFHEMQGRLTYWSEEFTSLLENSGLPNMATLVDEARAKNEAAVRQDQTDLDAWLRRVVGSTVSLAEMLEGQEAKAVQDTCRKMLKDEENANLSFVEHQLYKEALRLVTKQAQTAQKKMSIDDLRQAVAQDITPYAENIYDKLNAKHLIDQDEWAELEESDTPHRLVAYIEHHRDDSELASTFADAVRIGRRGRN